MKNYISEMSREQIANIINKSSSRYTKTCVSLPSETLKRMFARLADFESVSYVLDPEGVNVENGQIVFADDYSGVYCDDVNGYMAVDKYNTDGLILSSERAAG